VRSAPTAHEAAEAFSDHITTLIAGFNSQQQQSGSESQQQATVYDSLSQFVSEFSNWLKSHRLAVLSE
jgi:hypothetical protein